MAPLTYKEAGVDVEGADAWLHSIAALVKRTHDARVVSRAAYASLFRVGGAEGGPLLAASCDGVGTKLLVAREVARYLGPAAFRGLGQDLVAMNVNDLIVVGARPLFFFDYIAAGSLERATLTSVVEGMSDACVASGCALLGGETAEMPGVYAPGDFDLAGFAVGLVDEGRAPNPAHVRAGDLVLALPSSGVHSNGFSLVRKSLERSGVKFDQHRAELGATVGEALLEPTALYVRPVLEAMARVHIKAAAHITGGGLLRRAAALVTSASETLSVRIAPDSYALPPIFDVIAQAGTIARDELARTFNMGLGFLVVVTAADAALLQSAAPAWLHVGEIVDANSGERVDLGYARG